MLVHEPGASKDDSGDRDEDVCNEYIKGNLGVRGTVIDWDG